MECDLCKRESTDGSLLCATCAEAIRRLLAIHEDGSANALMSSGHTQPHGLRAAKASARDA
jgi:hypothetical protein